MFIAILGRVLAKKDNNNTVIILYGHKFNGNLRSFYDYLIQKDPKDIKVHFATMDPKYYEEIKEIKNTLSILKLKDVIHVGKADFIITDHGPHILSPFMFLTTIKFIDVWHGFAFKKYESGDFKAIHKFEQVWVRSSKLKQIYTEKLGFNSDQVVPTGYSRIDPLINDTYDRKKIMTKYGIKSGYEKYILIAPTWKHEDKGRKILPFGVDEKEFFQTLDEQAKKLNSLIIFRAHLNSNDLPKTIILNNTVFMSYKDYPLAEEFLSFCNLLVTDWSSICFDFLPLKRPTIFLDVPVPFKNGLNLDKEYRFGDIARTFEELQLQIEINITDPNKYLQRNGKKINKAREFMYGGTDDGKASQRYLNRIRSLNN